MGAYLKSYDVIYHSNDEDSWGKFAGYSRGEPTCDIKMHFVCDMESARHLVSFLRMSMGLDVDDIDDGQFIRLKRDRLPEPAAPPALPAPKKKLLKP